MSRVERMTDAEVRRAYAILFDAPAEEAAASPIEALRQVVRDCETQIETYRALGFDWEPEDEAKIVRAGLLDAAGLAA